MSGKIRVLPQNVFEKIAAGEVITSPMAVIKEIVENAIDAGATVISVSIEDGGKKLMRVDDNGSGIAEDELNLAVFPHATSKIRESNDLDEIRTLGFRGEALASIAAVSKLTIVSRTTGAREGASLYVAGGEAANIRKAGAPEGTGITVEDLFYNVPARRKFLKSDRAETADIVAYTARMAVAWPHIRFSVGHNGIEDFVTPGNGDVSAAIAGTAGTAVAANLLYAEKASAEGDMRLAAYLSPPDIDRKTRKNQYFFVNGRSVADAVLAEAVKEAYKGLIFEGRFPVVYLFLEIDPRKIDVNVHPSKTQIRFSNKNAVRDFVETMIRDVLIANGSTAKIRSAADAGRLKRAENAFYALKPSPETPGAPGTEPSLVREDGVSGSDIYAAADDSKIASVPISSLWKGQTDAPVTANGTDTGAEAAAGDGEGEQRGGNAGLLNGEDAASGRETPGTRLADALKTPPEVIGRLFGLYILARTEDEFFIIDQHAAHERIHYERFLAQAAAKGKLTQQLLTPLIVNIPAVSNLYTDSWAAWLGDLGFEIDEFGEKTFAVRAFPAFLSYEEAESFLTDILENASGRPPENTRAAERLISRACRSSVKMNDSLTNEEAAALIKQLFACENPYTCPHGRPVFIAMTGAELDRMFKREG
ncbi:MAG: DNA mismatch repair endonuclease MutL [Clostridiales Family XIII bacterium]|jgi:DNA mismatch repair protein MutL|nr:DNA mismatch repair endonuclease MutL [Clostridiales Family XIII bacterium]